MADPSHKPFWIDVGNTSLSLSHSHSHYPVGVFHAHRSRWAFIYSFCCLLVVLRGVVSTHLTDDAVSALVLAVVVELCGSGQEDSFAIEHESINQYWAAVRIHIGFQKTLPENN